MWPMGLLGGWRGPGGSPWLGRAGLQRALGAGLELPVGLGDGVTGNLLRHGVPWRCAQRGWIAPGGYVDLEQPLSQWEG